MSESDIVQHLRDVLSLARRHYEFEDEMRAKGYIQKPVYLCYHPELLDENVTEFNIWRYGAYCIGYRWVDPETGEEVELEGDEEIEALDS